MRLKILHNIVAVTIGYLLVLAMVIAYQIFYVRNILQVVAQIIVIQLCRWYMQMEVELQN